MDYNFRSIFNIRASNIEFLVLKISNPKPRDNFFLLLLGVSAKALFEQLLSLILSIWFAHNYVN